VICNALIVVGDAHLCFNLDKAAHAEVPALRLSIAIICLHDYASFAGCQSLRPIGDADVDPPMGRAVWVASAKEESNGAPVSRLIIRRPAVEWVIREGNTRVGAIPSSRHFPRTAPFPISVVPPVSKADWGTGSGESAAKANEGEKQKNLPHGM
jgi:hypothetical protein